MTIHPLSKITPSSECWRIMVRVVRLYTLPAYNDERTTNSIEMVFMDEHGTTIHATVWRSLVGNFEKRIKEGSVYVFAYFGIGISSGNYQTSRHEFRLNFQPRTTVTASSYSMGVLTAVGKQKEIVKESKKTKMIVIQLEADGVTLDITLFGEYVDKIKSFFGKQPLENAIIVIQYAKVKTYQGNIILQNVMYGTRLLLNPEIEEVVAFRQRAVRADGTMYYCMYCACRVMNVTPRYRIKTRVVDTTDSATFVVLESVGCLLLHKSCSEMLKYSENLPSGDIKPDNLIEDFVQSKDNQFERLGDDITDSTIDKRIEEVETDYVDGHEPSKKMKTVKIEKI
ncbi:unnamed protein product [Cuscuta campestris]|uniref:Replication protein A 70 kDa DNA-binding subunit B/D first OB fold domain-containing protein n=1 Tax=Cuscuta campestris TaxID=132261 RepID=A0A484LLY9_9ASTE|nr:unnamed protein product [Cuscuta campestris]